MERREGIDLDRVWRWYQDMIEPIYRRHLASWTRIPGAAEVQAYMRDIEPYSRAMRKAYKRWLKFRGRRGAK
jgi:hypothetical protein